MLNNFAFDLFLWNYSALFGNFKNARARKFLARKLQ